MNQPLSADEVLAAALALAGSSARSAYLDRACAGDLTLRQEVESLLAAAERAGTFLESPATEAVEMLRETLASLEELRLACGTHPAEACRVSLSKWEWTPPTNAKTSRADTIKRYEPSHRTPLCV